MSRRLPRLVTGYVLLAALVSFLLGGGPGIGFLVVTLFACAVHYYLCRRITLKGSTVVTVALLLRLLFVWLSPTLSDDMHRYVWDGHLQVHGFNPYLHLPSDPELQGLHLDGRVDSLNSSQYYSVYPPLSQVVFVTAAAIGRGDPGVTFFAIKGIFLLLEFGGVLLLATIVAPRRLAFYAWHPVVLIEVAGQAHTEAAAVIFLIAAVVFSSKHRHVLSSVALTVAAMVKVWPALFLPWVWRRGRLAALVAAAVTAAVFAVPYWRPGVLSNFLSSIDLYVRLFEFNAGPYYAVKELGRLLTGDDLSKSIGPIMRRLFFLGLFILYMADTRRPISLARFMVIGMTLYFALATTVHPWYLVPVLALVAATEAPGRHWLWLAAASMGTYMLYVDGPYWPFVVAGWSGWTVLMAIEEGPAFVDRALRLRARRKVGWIGPYVQPSARVLDLGAGEGYVADELRRGLGIGVVAADIVDMTRTPDEIVIVPEEGPLPFRDQEFEHTLLCFVLHHARNPDAVLRETARVTNTSVVAIESVYRSNLGRALLRLLDVIANRLRSQHMWDREELIHFRTVEEWERTFATQGMRVLARQEWGVIHRHALFVLAPHPDADR